MIQQKPRTSRVSWMMKPLSEYKQGSSLGIARYSTSLVCVFMVLLTLLLSAAGYPEHSVSARPIQKFTLPPSVYYGVHVPGWLQDMSAVTTFEQDANKSASIVMWYQGWGLQDGTQNFEPTWMNNVRNHGSIPMVTWEPWLYTQGPNQPTYSLQNIISGKFDAYITKWAQDSKAWGHPYFLRFAHEMNGNWYPWSEQVNGNKAGQYVKAWQHVHDIFTKLGVKNVTWVWSPNVESAKTIPLQELYPGSAYVDWIGMDGYNWGSVDSVGWKSFAQVFQQTHKDIVNVAKGKPLMVAETASAEVGGNKSAWIADAFTTQLTQAFSDVKAVIWFDENKETDWRIESSSTAMYTFVKAISSNRYASNAFGNLSVSPIPVL